MRLIDADKIREFADYYTELDGEPLTEREKLLVTCVCEKIRGLMPTAYDVDKVVERLKGMDAGGIHILEDGKYHLIRMEEAMKIVKAGIETDIEEKEECSSAKEET